MTCNNKEAFIINKTAYEKINLTGSITSKKTRNGWSRPWKIAKVIKTGQA